MDEIAEKFILNAQREFYNMVSDVRKEMAADAKQMRQELLVEFRKAHQDNQERMEEIISTLNEHKKEDARSFAFLNRLAFGILGIITFLTFMSQVGDMIRQYFRHLPSPLE